MQRGQFRRFVGSVEDEKAGLLLYSGALAQAPRQAGLTWLHLQFLLGFRRLGWDVLFVDRLAPDMCVDESGRTAPFADSLNRRYFLQVLEEFGLTETYSLLLDDGERTVGLP